MTDQPNQRSGPPEPPWQQQQPNRRADDQESRNSGDAVIVAAVAALIVGAAVGYGIANWGDLPAWLAAIGTVLAVSVALWQVRADESRRRKQEHRAQADLIAAWYSGETESETHAVLCLLNDSSQPVYEAVATLTRSAGSGEQVHRDFRAVVPTVPPGRWTVEVAGDWNGMSAYPTAEVAFTDHRGDTHWIRRSNGKLDEIHESAIEHYDIGRPFDVSSLSPARPA